MTLTSELQSNDYYWKAFNTKESPFAFPFPSLSLSFSLTFLICMSNSIYVRYGVWQLERCRLVALHFLINKKKNTTTTWCDVNFCFHFSNVVFFTCDIRLPFFLWLCTNIVVLGDLPWSERKILISVSFFGCSEDLKITFVLTLDFWFCTTFQFF